MRHWWLGALLVLGACGEEPSGFTRVSPNGFFAPELLDFGTQGIGMAHTLDLVLTNSSAADLLISEISFEPASDAYVARLAEGATLKGARIARGERRNLKVIFGPSLEQRYDTTMLVTSELLQIELPLKGAGRLIQPATLSIAPASITFLDPIEVGREAKQALRVQNVGELPGRLQAIAAPSGVRVLNLGGSNGAPSLELAPGEGLDLDLRFRPASIGSFEHTVGFITDGDVQTDLPIRGTAVAAGTMSCTPTNLDLGMVGRGAMVRRTISCDVSGGAFTLESLGLRAGGDFTLENQSAGPGVTLSRLSFELVLRASGLPRDLSDTIDIRAAAGQWIQIPVTAILTPPPPQDAALTVILDWQTTNTDFDLHLVRTGFVPFQPGQDCHFGQKTIDWNQPGDSRDDPYLDRDDTLGPGIEQLTMVDAASGVYEVWVQYFAEPALGTPPVDVNISYQLKNGPMGAQQRLMSACGSMWHVGRARFDLVPPTFELVDAETNAYASFTDRCP